MANSKSPIQKITKHFELEDVPDIMSKLLIVIDDEVDRVLKMPVNKRETSDVRLALTCLQALTTIHKENMADNRAINLQFSTADHILAVAATTTQMIKKENDEK